MDPTTHRWFLPEGKDKRATRDSFVLPALVMPGGSTLEGNSNNNFNNNNTSASRREPPATMIAESMKRTPQQSQAGQFNFDFKGSANSSGNNQDNGRHAPQWPLPKPTPNLESIPASPRVGNWPFGMSPHSTAPSERTLVSPTHIDMQQPPKAYSPVTDGRPQLVRVMSSGTTASIATAATAQTAHGLVPLTRQNRDSWQSGRTSPTKSMRSFVRESRTGGLDSPLSPPPASKNYTTFTGFRPYSVHSSYTYVCDDAESEMCVPLDNGPGMSPGGYGGKQQMMLDSDGLPLRPTAEMMQKARRRQLIIRWSWAIGILCMIGAVVGVSLALLNAFHVI